MRPTDLNYRSPKEKTAEYLLPKVTNNGNMLLEITTTKKHPNFSQGPRFHDYKIEAKKTGYRVGPGSYEQWHYSVNTDHIKGAHVYKKYHRKSDMGNNAYIFIGNQIMFDANFMMPSKKHTRQSISHTIDITDFNSNLNDKPSRSTTSNTPAHRLKNRPSRLSPSYEEFNYSIRSR